ncbi:DUF4190 domain-containing protein [Ancylomarina salipaludis]|uniref:DUF4190 domain-containing protein n=1 Tax=Ancylomarina salipaludis TaxID=2501299 RepID=A0A4V1N051_9BACT|nr:DUF4190 domain-containing protein [Ancylomarina salipaludis]RXQ94935.1 DUF4190 domain-containing protein [Ancylomarina salipaludis]
MEMIKTNAGQGFGVAGLILGILCLFMAFIPCIGVIAIGPGVIAIVLSIVGLVQANNNNGARGINIAALVVSALGTLIACVWLFVFVGIASLDDEQIEGVVKDVIEEVVRESNSCNSDLQDELNQLEKQLDSIKVDKTIHIETDSTKIEVHIERK